MTVVMTMMMVMMVVMMMKTGMMTLQKRIRSGTTNKGLLSHCHLLLQDRLLQDHLLQEGLHPEDLLQAHLLCHQALSPILVPKNLMSVVSLMRSTASLKHWLPNQRVVLPLPVLKPICLIHLLAMTPKNFPNFFSNAASTFVLTPCTSRPMHLRSTLL
jgi:hypothetical protein